MFATQRTGTVPHGHDWGSQMQVTHVSESAR